MSCYKKSFEANLPRNSKQPAETMVDGLVQPRWIFLGSAHLQTNNQALVNQWFNWGNVRPPMLKQSGDRQNSLDEENPVFGGFVALRPLENPNLKLFHPGDMGMGQSSKPIAGMILW